MPILLAKIIHKLQRKIKRKNNLLFYKVPEIEKIK